MVSDPIEKSKQKPYRRNHICCYFITYSRDPQGLSSKNSHKKDLFIFECFWRHPEEFKYVGCGSRNVRRKGTKIRFSPACRSARPMCVIPAILRGLPRPASGNDCQAAPRSHGTRFTPSKNVTVLCEITLVTQSKNVAVFERDNVCYAVGNVAVWECDNTCYAIKKRHGLKA